MNPFLQGMLGAGLCAVAFAAGVAQGVTRSAPAGGQGTAVPNEIRLVVPENITVTQRGLISDKERCLEWVSANFKEPNVGQLAMICAGAHL